MTKKRTVFFISDGTAITAEDLGHSLLTQFNTIEFEYHTLPFIDSPQKVSEAIATINASSHDTPPLVIASLMTPQFRKEIIDNTNAILIDFFQVLLNELSNELKEPYQLKIGKAQSIQANKNYPSRISAINFTMSTDDGVNLHQYKNADVILVGVSRSGKTPTSLYLALRFAIKAANYPLVNEDIAKEHLPKILQPFKKKLFGLTIDTTQLEIIRRHRQPKSDYASRTQCKQEIKATEALFKQENIPFLNTTHLSIEEISTKILDKLSLTRK